MLEFGETIALTIAAVVIVYIVANWRRMWSHRRFRAFLIPFAFMACGWIATVAEGFFLEGPDLPLMVFGPHSAEIGSETPTSWLLHTIEIASYLAAAASLFVLILRNSLRARETPA